MSSGADMELVNPKCIAKLSLLATAQNAEGRVERHAAPLAAPATPHRSGIRAAAPVRLPPRRGYRGRAPVAASAGDGQPPRAPHTRVVHAHAAAAAAVGVPLLPQPLKWGEVGRASERSSAVAPHKGRRREIYKQGGRRTCLSDDQVAKGVLRVATVDVCVPPLDRRPPHRGGWMDAAGVDSQSRRPSQGSAPRAAHTVHILTATLAGSVRHWP